MEGKNRRRISAALLVTAFGAATAGAAFAEEFYVGGRVRAGTSLAVDPPFGEDGTSFGITQYLTQIDGTWKPNDAWSVDGSLWLRGDFFSEMNDGDYEQGAIQGPSGIPPFRDRFHYNLSEDGTGTGANPFGSDSEDGEALSEFEDVFRKLAVTYADPKGRFSATAGKFQRGWGQADGLRLLDILYAQDLRQRAIFTDTEDLRINAATVALDLNLDAMGLGAPFNAIGMGNPTLELLYIPEVRHAEFVINNPTPSSRTSGGMFGLAFPRLIDGPSGWGTPGLSANVRDKEFDAFEEEELAARLKFDAFGGEATINGFYGYQDLPIVEVTGANLIIGNALNDETSGAFVLPNLDAGPGPLMTAVTAVHGPFGAFGSPGVGGLLPFIRVLAGVIPPPPGSFAPPGIGGPNGMFEGFGGDDNFAGFDSPLALFGCATPFTPVGAPCSVNANFTADYTYRQKTAGFSFTRDIRELKMGRKNVSPVLRFEFSYEFEKPFQLANAPTPFGTMTGTGVGSLAVPIGDSVVEKDQNSLLIGVDYFLWIPGWESQQSSMFITSQFFNIHTEDGEDLLWQAPYTLTTWEDNWNYFTQTWNLPLMDEKLTLDGLFIWDIDKKGLAYRQRIEYAMMGGQLKPRLEWGYFDGHQEEGLLGTFGNSDYVELSIGFQF